MKLEKFKEWAKLEALPKIQEHPVPLAVTAAGGMVVGLLWIGGHIITVGVISGTLMAVCAGVILWKFKTSKIRLVKKAYDKVVDHPLLADIGITGAAFALAPAGITAWIAATVCGLLASCWLLAEYSAKVVAVST